MVKGTGFLPGILLKNILLGDANAGSRPHIGNVEVFMPVIVKIEPRDAHPRANIFDAGLPGHVGEGPITIVPIKVFSPKIIHDIEVWPVIAIVIAPTATEAEAGVVLIQARLLRDVAKSLVAVIAHHEVWRTIFCVKIGCGITILIGALVIGVYAEIDVQPTVAVIVGNRSPGKCASWRRGELESVRF